MLVTGEPVRAADIDEVVVGSGYWSRQRLDEAVAEYGLPTEPVATASPTPTPTPWYSVVVALQLLQGVHERVGVPVVGELGDGLRDRGRPA